MKRISVDNFSLISPKKDDVFFPAKRRRNAWYASSPKLFTTLLCFMVWYCWSQLGGNIIEIPGDQFAFIEDPSLVDILNTTLGFEKILILNLPFRTDRRDAMTLSAATSNIHLEFLDGVTGESIKPSAYPPPLENQKLQAGIRGSWRTHMSALQTIVEQNITTALIMEDDVDWDIRIRQNLQRFALASRFLAEKKGTLSNPQYDIENRPNTETKETSFQILNENKIGSTLPSLPLSSINSASHQPTTHSSSPYGNPAEWDILWIGHCGAGFPRSSSAEKNQPVTAANVILTQADDDTVPNSQHLKAHPFQGTLDPLASAYPPHTRIFHRATGGELCTVAYAVSQRGARRLLHQFGVKGWNGIFDSELGRWCAGEDPDMGPHARPPPASSGGKSAKAKERVCLTSQPPIFAHHHPQQGESDIGGLGGGYARKFETKYLRLSVRMNLERIVNGAKDRELVDQWPDEGGQVIP
ncbi:glycosyltransferase family 25 protein [Periconia macrospinosa]|uniref:Glycosyltransferase family 25 protein n=1 Tax=Periconia macrospinosa TaxID=97972 RepID=A0A2V1DUM3_9PLEO|nr:glycosyltransferase family 25 protein [Periconia macrospinosa]